MKYEVKDLESKRTLGYAQNLSAARLQATRFTTLARVGVFVQGAERPFIILKHGMIIDDRVVKAAPPAKKRRAVAVRMSSESVRSPVAAPVLAESRPAPVKKVIIRRAAETSNEIKV